MIPVVREGLGPGVYSGPEMPRRSVRKRGGELCRTGSGVRCMFHRVLSGRSKEGAGTLEVDSPITGRPCTVQDLSPARRCAGQADGCGRGVRGLGAQASGLYVWMQGGGDVVCNATWNKEEGKIGVRASGIPEAVVIRLFLWPRIELAGEKDSGVGAWQVGS